MHPFRLLLFAFFVFATIPLTAQDWAPIHPDQTYHFRSENGLLLDQTILVDSTYEDGNSDIWLLNPLTRDCDTCSIYGSILVNQPTVFGRRVTVEPDGAYLFSDPYEMRILPLAEVGENWTFSNSPMVQATVTSATEESILGQMDSVKVISLSTGDSLILSKSFGIIWGKAMPPYEAEYYELVGVESPETGFVVPDFFDCFEFEVGDVFQYRNVQQWQGDQNEERLKLTVLSKEVFADSIQYDARRVSRTRKTTNFGYPFDTTYIEDTIRWVFRQSEWAWTDAYHHQLVENTIHPNINGENTSVVQVKESAGTTIKSVGSGDLMNGTYEPLPSDSSIYILSWVADGYVRDAEPGLGQTSYYLWIFEVTESSDLIGYVKGGDTTGTVYSDEELLTSLFSPVQPASIEMRVFPNPTSDLFQVVWEGTNHEPSDVILVDATGRILEQQKVTAGSNSLEFSLEGYPAGIFRVVLVTGSGIDIRTVIKQ